MNSITPFLNCYQGIHEMPQPLQGSLLTIGNFDGLHLGHVHLLQKLLSLKKKYPHLPTSVLTFYPHPRQVLLPKPHWPYYLLSIEDRVQQLKDKGLDCIVVQPFTKDFAHLSPFQFVSQYLLEPFSPRALVVGTDFSFGYKRQGELSYLDSLCKAKGIAFYPLPPLRGPSGQKVSSSTIRKALEEGDMTQARALLGRPFSISSSVEKGAGRGQGLGFPTANLSWPTPLLLPKRGVYVVLAQDLSSLQKWPAVANLGKAPTFSSVGSTLQGKSKLKLEVHVLKASKSFKGLKGLGDARDLRSPQDSKNLQGLDSFSLYGKNLKVEFLHYLREEKTFEKSSQLKEQIQQDVIEAYNILQKKEGIEV